MKFLLKQQDFSKKVLHALHLFLLTEELITRCLSQKVLCMDHLHHLILFLKPLPNRNIMSSKITLKAFKNRINLKTY